MRSRLFILMASLSVLGSASASAQSVSALKKCYEAADKQFEECINWGHAQSACATTWTIVNELCEAQF